MKSERGQRKKMERCVRCGKQTVYTLETPVQLRSYYVEGAGQLCRECWINIYGKKRVSGDNA